MVMRTERRARGGWWASRALCVTPLLLVTSCLTLDLGPSDAGADSGASGAGGSDAADATVGAGCALDPISGVTLCRAISACPTLVVDSDLFPHCGFRVHADALDLQCLCSDALCPMGTATNCAQAAALLSSQSELQVCTQVSEQRCAGGAPSGTPAGESGGASGNGCDRGCAADCAGEPGCYRLCGC